jgi:hypothetical protein
LERSFWWEINTIIEKIKELLKGSVVHPVDLSHFYDTEVKYSTSCSNRSELFSLLINFDSLLSSFDKLFIDFFRCVLDGGKYINNIWVVK